MTAFLDMDGYGLYIWISYGVSFTFVIGAGLHSWWRDRQQAKNTG